MQIINGPLGKLAFPQSDSWMSFEYQKGHVQYEVLDEALKFVTKTRTAIDAGAHVGVSSLKLREIFDKVHAFEPCFDTWQCLAKNLLEHRNVTPHNFALSDREMEFSLEWDTRYQGNSGGMYLVAKKDEECYNNCHSKLLDQYNFDDVDFIKIDTEGTEKFVLLGAVETIKRSWPVIVCEEKGRLMKRQGVGAEDVRLFLKSLGYQRVSNVNRDFVYVKG